MTIELVKILEAAKEAHEQAMYYFDLHANEEDEDMREIYWTRSEELDGLCSGLLQAYEILTGKMVRNYAIDEELALA